MTHLVVILIALAFFHEVFLGCKCYCGDCCDTGNCCEPCQRSVTRRRKAFIDFFNFTGLLLATVIVSSLLMWHPWTYNPKAHPPESATAAQPVSYARTTAAALDRVLQASQEQEKIAKSTALREVIQRFHLPVHKGYPVISTVEERNALPPGTTYLTNDGQYAVQLSRVGASP